MPRANRHYIPGFIWHITHRCHDRKFLLRFARDRRRWLYWLFQAKKRYGLCVLNYSLTSNHIHLLVFDKGSQTAIPSSMDLIASRIAQEYNQRKNRRGAFWESRYHASAVESSEHLSRCMAYIDLNMVRAGLVRHPLEWPFCGYNEIIGNRQRYNLIHWPSLLKLLRMKDRKEIKLFYKEWIENTLATSALKREGWWTESVAVGSQEFVKRVEAVLVEKARWKREKDVRELGRGIWVLKEERRFYGNTFVLGH